MWCVQGMLSPMIGSIVEYAGLFTSFSLCKTAGTLFAARFLSETVTKDLVCWRFSTQCSHTLTVNAFLFLFFFFFQQSERKVLMSGLAGCGAGVTVAILLTPVELIKCQLQVRQADL